jgi:hypothetical protein
VKHLKGYNESWMDRVEGPDPYKDEVMSTIEDIFIDAKDNGVRVVVNNHDANKDDIENKEIYIFLDKYVTEHKSELLMSDVRDSFERLKEYMIEESIEFDYALFESQSKIGSKIGGGGPNLRISNGIKDFLTASPSVMFGHIKIVVKIK